MLASTSRQTTGRKAGFVGHVFMPKFTQGIGLTVAIVTICSNQVMRLYRGVQRGIPTNGLAAARITFSSLDSHTLLSTGAALPHLTRYGLPL